MLQDSSGLLCVRNSGLYMSSRRLAVCVDSTWRRDCPEECKGYVETRVKNQVGLRLYLGFDLQWTLRLV
jgi:hypothetical protein